MQKIFFGEKKINGLHTEGILLISFIIFDHNVFEIKSTDFIQLLYVESDFNCTLRLIYKV